MKIVIGSNHLGENFAKQLADTFPNVQFIPAYDEAAQVKAAAGAEVFFGWPSRQAFLAGKNLRWIHCPGMGIDRIVAVREIVDSDVLVTNAPGSHVIPMADWTLAVMLALAHNLQQSVRDQDARKWRTAAYAGKIIELAGMRLGIYGLGAIGRAVAVRAAGFGMEIRAVDPGPSEIPECVSECWSPDRLDDLARWSQWLVVTAPIKPETSKKITKARLKLMPRGSYVIVASRGGIVDEAALAEELVSGHLAGAALDATETEPLPLTSPLWSLPSVILTPHASALSPQLYEGRRRIFIESLKRYLKGDQPLHICDKRSGF